MFEKVDPRKLCTYILGMSIGAFLLLAGSEVLLLEGDLQTIVSTASCTVGVAAGLGGALGLAAVEYADDKIKAVEASMYNKDH